MSILPIPRIPDGVNYIRIIGAFGAKLCLLGIPVLNIEFHDTTLNIRELVYNSIKNIRTGQYLMMMIENTSTLRIDNSTSKIGSDDHVLALDLPPSCKAEKVSILLLPSAKL